jgi:putative transposase
MPEAPVQQCLHTAVANERYLMTVHRYIELNPVRAAMVAAAELYRWSSVHVNLALRWIR